MSMASPLKSPNFAHPGVRRAATVPTQLLQSQTILNNPTSEPIEVLYEHPSVKIISFTVSVPRPGSVGRSGASTPEPASPISTSISWRSAAERTLASGAFRIYRVPSSGVSFLNSGTFLRHILPRTQCWCVDQVAKFVFRVNRQGSFYRIELPSTTEQDKIKLQEFKTVLSQILQYEQVPSPFVTGTLEIEEEGPPTPVRRQSTRPQEKAKKWVFNKSWEPEDLEHRERYRRTSVDIGSSRVKRMVAAREGRSISPAETSRTQSPMPPASESGSEADSCTSGASIDQEEAKEEPVPLEVAPKRIPRPLFTDNLRSVTAPPQLTQRPLTPPQQTKQDERFDSPLRDEELLPLSHTTSSTSFFTAEEPTSPQVVPADLDNSIVEATDLLESLSPIKTPKRRTHRRDASDVTIKADAPDKGIDVDVFSEPQLPNVTISAASSRPSTPPLIPDTDDSSPIPLASDNFPTTPEDTLRLRRLTHRLANASYTIKPNRFSIDSQLSTTSATATVYHTPPASPRAQKMLSAILQKAYSMILGPPTDLIATMLRIAARVCLGLPIFYDQEEIPGQGRRRSTSSDPGPSHTRMPGHWDSSASEASVEMDNEDDDEDDFGVSLKNRPQVEVSGGRDPLHAFNVGSRRSSQHTSYANSRSSSFAYSEARSRTESFVGGRSGSATDFQGVD